MQLVKRVVIDEGDVSGLHSEITDIIDFFIENSVGGPDDKWVKTEFPNLMKLKSLLSHMVIAEPQGLVLDRLNELEARQTEKATQARFPSRLKVVKLTGGRDHSPLA